MDVPTWVYIGGAYFAGGLVSAGAWSLIAWRTDEIQDKLARFGYESAKSSVQESTLTMILIWGFAVPGMIISALYEWLSEKANPHLGHRKSWEEKMKTLAIEEKAFPGETSSVELIPECACQIDPNEDEDLKDPYLNGLIPDEVIIERLKKQRSALKTEIKRLRSIGLT